MKNVLGSQNPYFYGAIAQIFIARYFGWQLVCGAVALLHLVAEKLYFGRPFGKVSLGLLIGLCSLSLLGGYWLQPKLKQWHLIKYAVNTRPEQREAASRSFRAWHGVSQGANLVLLGGLAVYLWRVANPSDATRFVNTAKFRG